MSLIGVAPVIWQAHLRSLRNSLRFEGRARLAWVGSALLGALIVALLTRSLGSRFASLPRGAILHEAAALALGCWALSGGAAFAITLALGFGGEPAKVLLALPIPPQGRLRALLGLVAARLSPMLAPVVLASALALRRHLGAEALLWGLYLILGASGVSALGALGAVAAVRARLFWRARFALLLSLAAAAAAAAFSAPRLSGVELSRLVAPISLLLLAAAALAAGPAAAWLGGLYFDAAVELQTGSRGSARRRRLALAERVLALPRNSFGALAYRGFIARARSPFTALRLILFASGVVAAVFLCPSLIQRLGPAPALAACCLAVVQVTLNEAVVQAVAGEGARLELVLVSPLTISRFLWSRLAVALLPVLAAGMGMLAALGAATGAGLRPAIVAGLAVAAILFGNTAFLALGGSWDLDLGTRPEGAMDILLQEEAPIAPRRLLVFNISMGLQAAAVWVLFVQGASGLVPIAASAAAVALVSHGLARWRIDRLIAGE